jgi:hypothetical protein
MISPQFRLRALAAITVLATAWISFSSSQDLAMRAGFGIRSWAFPICLDAVAAFATDCWMRRTAAQRPAATLALFAIGLSLASNVADHYLVAGTALAALLGGIPPAMLAWLLLVLHKHGQPGRTVTETAPRRGPEPATPVVTEKQPMAPWLIKIPAGPIPYPPVNEALPKTLGIPEDSPLLDPGGVVDDGEPITTTPRVDVHSGRKPEPVLSYPLPVNVPDNDPERTQIMPRITDEQPGKLDPAAPDDPAPAKVQPARREATGVSAPVEKVSKAYLSNEDLIQLALAERITSRRAIAAAYGLGTNRAGDIARAVKEKSDG